MTGKFIMTGLPTWLLPPKLDRGPPYHEDTVEKALLLLSGGSTVAKICREDPMMPKASELVKFLHSSPELQERYYEAQRIGAEVMVDQMMSIAMGDVDEEREIPMSEKRATLAISTIKWVASRRNTRYQETTKIDVTAQIDLTGAIAKGMARAQSSRTFNNDLAEDATIIED